MPCLPLAAIGLLGFFVVALPCRARANVQEVFGLSPRAASMANAFTAVADDFSACWYNPAGLAQTEGHSLTLGYLFCQPRLKQYLLFDSGGPNTAEATPFRSMIFGCTVDLARLFDTRGRGLVLGTAACLGGDNFTMAYRIHDWRPEVPRFPRYGDYANRAHIFAGVGLEVWRERVLVGAGFNFWENLDVKKVKVRVDLNSQVLYKDLDARGEFEIAPVAGILAKPLPWLALAYVYRDGMAQDSIVRLDTVLDLGLFPVPLEELSENFRDYFLPWNMTLAARIEPVGGFRVSVEATYYHWSDYRLPAWEERIAAWESTVVPRIGLEYAFREDLALRAGYFFEASPVKDQSRAESNQLDFDRHVFSAGFGWSFSRLPLVGDLGLKEPVVLDGFLQGQWMASREQEKDPSTGQPGWRIEGYQIAAGFAFTVSF